MTEPFYPPSRRAPFEGERKLDASQHVEIRRKFDEAREEDPDLTVNAFAVRVCVQYGVSRRSITRVLGS